MSGRAAPPHPGIYRVPPPPGLLRRALVVSQGGLERGAGASAEGRAQESSRSELRVEEDHHVLWGSFVTHSFLPQGP